MRQSALQLSATLAAISAAGLLCAGCFPGTSEAAFVGDREEILCSGVWPACQGQYAGCMLDEDHVLSGTFPGTRKFLVESPPGDWAIKVKLFLDPDTAPRYPGTETEISWFEPGCADQYRYQLSRDVSKSGDLFERAGRDNVFETQRSVIEAGDHLVTLYSDATSRYVVRIALVKVR